MTTRSKTIRSMLKMDNTSISTKTTSKKNNTKPNAKYTVKYAVIPKSKSDKTISTEIVMVDNPNSSPETTKPSVDIVTMEELIARGLTPDSETDGKWKKVIKTTDLDVLLWREEYKNKWVVAPEGWYWKDYSKKCYFWFDWCELEPIP